MIALRASNSYLPPFFADGQVEYWAAAVAKSVATFLDCRQLFCGDE